MPENPALPLVGLGHEESTRYEAETQTIYIKCSVNNVLYEFPMTVEMLYELSQQAGILGVS